MSMFVQGYENFGTQIDLQKQRSQRERKKDRLFVGKGKTLNFVFLDDPGIGLSEHRIAFGQSDFNNFYTCLKDVCPLCHANFNPTFISIYTVFDLTPWEKEGKRHSFTKKLFTPSGTDIELLINIRKQFGGSLKGAVMTMTKGSGGRDRAVVTPYLKNGSIVRLSDEQLMQYVIRDGYKPELAKPFDYQVLFANDSVEYLKAVMSRALLSKDQKQQRQQMPQHVSFESEMMMPADLYSPEQQFNAPPQQQQQVAQASGVALQPNIPDIPF